MTDYLETLAHELRAVGIEATTTTSPDTIPPEHVQVLETTLDLEKVEELTKLYRKDYDQYSVCATLAEHGNYDCLKLAREKGYEWDSEPCSYTAFWGDLERLKWLNDLGCPMDKNTFYAFFEGSPKKEMFDYLLEKDCPMHHSTRQHATEIGWLY